MKRSIACPLPLVLGIAAAASASLVAACSDEGVAKESFASAQAELVPINSTWPTAKALDTGFDAPVVCEQPPTVPAGSLNLTFLVATDPQLGDEKVLTHMRKAMRLANRLNGAPGYRSKHIYLDSSWSPFVSSSGLIDNPIAMIITGDLVHWKHEVTYAAYRYFFDSGTSDVDGRPDSEVTSMPVFPLIGNHDDGAANDCREHRQTRMMYDYVHNKLFRNIIGGDPNNNRWCQILTGFDPKSHNYSWDWQGVHFVALNTWAGDELCKRSGDNRFEPNNGALWLKADLEAHAQNNKPVVLFQHYPYSTDHYDPNQWTEEQARLFDELIEPYNVVVMFAGHLHDRRRYTNTKGNIDMMVGAAIGHNSQSWGWNENGFYAVNIRGNLDGPSKELSIDTAFLEVKDDNVDVLYQDPHYYLSKKTIKDPLGYCLTANDGTRADLPQVFWAACNADRDQLWESRPDGRIRAPVGKSNIPRTNARHACLTIGSAWSGVAHPYLEDCDSSLVTIWQHDAEGRLCAADRDLCLTQTPSPSLVAIPKANLGPHARWSFFGGDAQLSGEIRGMGGKCLDILTDSGEPNTPLVVRTCDGSKTQQWRWENGSQLQNRANGYCARPSESHGPVVLSSCDDSAKAFYFTTNGQFRSQQGQCLDIKDANIDPASGQQVITWPCQEPVTAANQYWEIAKNQCGTCGENAHCGEIPIEGGGGKAIQTCVCEEGFAGDGQTCVVASSCKDLHEQAPQLSSGVYPLIIPTPTASGWGLARADVFCDMEADGGGWTLIEATSSELGPTELSPSSRVARTPGAYLPFEMAKALADNASRVVLRSPTDPNRWVMSKTAAEGGTLAPLINLRAGRVLNHGLNGQDPAAAWKWGPQVTSDMLRTECSPDSRSYPDMYWACNNANGLHVVNFASRWTYLGADQPIEILVR